MQDRPQATVSPGFSRPREFYRDKLSREGVSSPRDGVRNLVVIVVAVVVSIVVVIIPVMVGHRVADGRAANPAYHRADWTAHNRPADRASDATGHGPT